jgi:hypothetical protein
MPEELGTDYCAYQYNVDPVVLPTQVPDDPGCKNCLSKCDNLSGYRLHR